jgi:hypothetical protein
MTVPPRRPFIAGDERVAANLDKHEAVCTERWTELRRAIEKMENKVDKFFWAMLGCAVSMVGTLLLQLIKMKGG